METGLGQAGGLDHAALRRASISANADVVPDAVKATQPATVRAVPDVSEVDVASVVKSFPDTLARLCTLARPFDEVLGDGKTEEVYAAQEWKVGQSSSAQHGITPKTPVTAEVKGAKVKASFKEDTAELEGQADLDYYSCKGAIERGIPAPTIVRHMYLDEASGTIKAYDPAVGAPKGAKTGCLKIETYKGHEDLPADMSKWTPLQQLGALLRFAERDGNEDNKDQQLKPGKHGTAIYSDRDHEGLCLGPGYYTREGNRHGSYINPVPSAAALLLAMHVHGKTTITDEMFDFMQTAADKYAADVKQSLTNPDNYHRHIFETAIRAGRQKHYRVDREIRKNKDSNPEAFEAAVKAQVELALGDLAKDIDQHPRQIGQVIDQTKSQRALHDKKDKSLREKMQMLDIGVADSALFEGEKFEWSPAYHALIVARRLFKI
jgi:hypothetical protein